MTLCDLFRRLHEHPDRVTVEFERDGCRNAILARCRIVSGDGKRSAQSRAAMRFPGHAGFPANEDIDWRVAQMVHDAECMLQKAYIDSLNTLPIRMNGYNSEKLPNDGERVQWFIRDGDSPRWVIGTFKKNPPNEKGLDAVVLDEHSGTIPDVQVSLTAFSHWRPLPPAPE